MFKIFGIYNFIKSVSVLVYITTGVNSTLKKKKEEG